MRWFTSCAVVLCVCAAVWADPPYYQDEMIAVHAKNTGPTFRISRFGDSITVSKAYFQPLQWGNNGTTAGSTERAAVTWIQAEMDDVCWSWQDSYQQHGAEGSTTSAWPLTAVTTSWPGYVAGERKIDYWLRVDKPDFAVIMFGSNDANGSLNVTTYKNNMRTIAQACMAAGTIPILTTPPPKHNRYSETLAEAQAIRELGTELQVPVSDYSADILVRNPDPLWDGAGTYWTLQGYSGYEVPTSISGNGVHPSNWTPGKSNFTADGLRTNGFNDYGYMTLMTSYNVYQAVIVPEPISLSALALGGLLVLRRRRR